MNVCDLVKILLLQEDINGDGEKSFNDDKILRLAILGTTDHAERG